MILFASLFKSILLQLKFLVSHTIMIFKNIFRSRKYYHPVFFPFLSSFLYFSWPEIDHLITQMCTLILILPG